MSYRALLSRPSFRAVLMVAITVAGAAMLAARVRLPRPDRIAISRGELFVLIAVVGLAVLIAAAATLSALRLLWRWLLPSRVSVAVPVRVAAGRRRRTAFLYVGLGVLEIAAVLWARHVEPFWLRARAQVVQLPGLVKPLRMVVLSDFHSDARFDMDLEIAKRVNAQQPDVIVFLGDALNSPDRAPRFRQALAMMQARFAKVAIRGNWDVWYWDGIDLYKDTGFVELGHGWRTIPAGDNRLRVGAHQFRDIWSPGHIVTPPPPGDGPAILLYHANDYIPAAARAGVDLYLCGDTHGGQLELPVWGALFSVGRQGRAYTRGLYREGSMFAYVTPGLGVERKFPLRFGVRPEITVLELTPALAKR